MKLRVCLVVEIEHDFHNICINNNLFYYSAGEQVNYFDFGGNDCRHHKYENLIRRMNKYFLIKKYKYD
jgi:hypothetical protein